MERKEWQGRAAVGGRSLATLLPYNPLYDRSETTDSACLLSFLPSSRAARALQLKRSGGHGGHDSGYADYPRSAESSFRGIMVPRQASSFYP